MVSAYHGPMRPRVLSAGLLLGIVLTACSTTPAPRGEHAQAPVPMQASSVLLVSLDGFRADYLDLGMTPNLARIAQEGVRAEWMNPSFPTLTFPNHYTLVTGLLPDHHGIVHNTMRDAAIAGDFRPSNRAAVGDSRWWGGEPIWVGAEKAGLRSATMYWPGSEAEIQGVRPTHWHTYDEQALLPLERRVDTVLGWLSAPRDTRPRVVTLYFETIDKQAHAHGPDSAEALQALRDADAAIGRLLQGLDQHGLRDLVDLVVVSDHGMATVPSTHAVAVEDVVTPEEARVVSIGQVITIEPQPGFEDTVTDRLTGAHAHFDCWRRQEVPARLRYGTHPRIPAIVCQMHEGWDMLPRAYIARRPAHDRGSHGYDPALPSMRALFLARGPSFREGITLPAFDNIDVYPLLARLAGIPAAPNDGNPATLLPALRAPESPAH